MRVIAVLCALVLAAAAGLVVLPAVVSPQPASARLAGVSVAVTGHTVEEIRGGKRLHVFVTVASARDLEECLAFALDMPFANRRLDVMGRECVRPRIERQAVSLVLDPLTEDDLAFPSHTVVWGVAGGRCHLVFQATGLCIVDMAGTARLELPPQTVLPTIGPLGSIGVFFSFPPIEVAP